MSNSTNDGPPETPRRRLKGYAITGFHLAMGVLSLCAGFGFPHQFWVEFYPLRWILFVAIIVYAWWFRPQNSETLAKITKDREASR